MTPVQEAECLNCGSCKVQLVSNRRLSLCALRYMACNDCSPPMHVTGFEDAYDFHILAIDKDGKAEKL